MPNLVVRYARYDVEQKRQDMGQDKIGLNKDFIAKILEDNVIALLSPSFY